MIDGIPNQPLYFTKRTLLPRVWWFSVYLGATAGRDRISDCPKHIIRRTVWQQSQLQGKNRRSLTTGYDEQFNCCKFDCVPKFGLKVIYEFTWRRPWIGLEDFGGLFGKVSLSFRSFRATATFDWCGAMDQDRICSRYLSQHLLLYCRA